MALRNEANAICEKPLLLNPWNVMNLQEIEQETGKRIFNILQLRHHNSIKILKEKYQNLPNNKIHDIQLTYITSRGKWYFYSWKGDIRKSGGVVTNIGIHFFDMLSWIFGGVVNSTVNIQTENKAAGILRLKNANVRWYLSLDKNDLPKKIAAKGQPTYRCIMIDGEELEFSGGFTDLHTISYKEILSGNGFGIEDAVNSIEIVHMIRNQRPIGRRGDYHPFVR